MHDIETLTSYRGEPRIQRCTVPGGWVYSIRWSPETATTTFVPFPDDYLGTPFNKCGMSTGTGPCVLGEGHKVPHNPG